MGVAPPGRVVVLRGEAALERVTAAQLRAAAPTFGLTNRGIYLVLAAYWILVNSLLEEYVWRWFVFTQCHTLAGRVTRHEPAARAQAAGAAALFFTLHHAVALSVQVPWRGGVLACTGVFIGGATWSWLYGRYQSIWPGYVSHVCADAAIFVIGWRVIFGP